MSPALIVAAVAELVMIGVSCYGWVTLPADARVPIHFAAGYGQFMPKPVGLIAHPVAGLVLLVVYFSTSRHHPGTHGSGSAEIIVPILACVLIAVQIGAISVARSRSGPRDMQRPADAQRP
jgi:hypothetical protein